MEELIVEGYLFQSKEDAALARGDAQKIELLQNRLDYSKSEEVLSVYRKAIEQHIFTTPVGMDFLKEMRGRLEEMEGITEEIPPVPAGRILNAPVAVSEQIKSGRPAKKNFDRQKYITAVLACVILGIGMIAMILISCNSRNPNILNYKRNLENQYSSWEQELREREDTVRQKELELRLNPEKE